MSEDIELEIDMSDLESDLKKVEKRGKTLKPIMSKVATVFKNAITKNFKEGGRASSDPDSPIGGNQRWKKLAPATVLSRLRKERGNSNFYTKKGNTRRGVLSSVRSMKILRDEGILAKSITASSTNSSAEASTNMIYARIHHYGGKAGKGEEVTIPARPFMQVQISDVDLSKKLVKDYVLKPTK